MRPDEGSSQGKVGRFAVATIILASVAVNAVLLGKLYRTTDHAGGASGAQARKAGRVTGESSPPHPEEPRRAGAIPERHGGVTNPSWPYGEKNAASTSAGHVDRVKGADSPPPATRGSWASVPHAGADGTRGDSGRGGPEARSAPTPPATTPVERSAERSQEAPRPGPVDSRAAVRAPSSGLQTPPSGVPREVTPPPETKLPVDVDPSSDRTPPVVESIHFDPPEVADGNVTILSIQASDDRSGVKSVWGTIRSPSGVAILSFGAQSESDSSVLASRISVPSKAEAGVWYISDLYLLDRAGNTLVGSFTPATIPAGGSMRVVSSEPDSTAPEVLRIWVEKGSVGGGEKNQISIEARDDSSGVANVSGAFQSPSKSALIGFNCLQNTETGFWVGEVSLPTNADCGEWRLQQLRIVDKAGNLAYLSGDSPQLARVAFDVYGNDCDSSPPTLETFNISPESVSNETPAEIQVTATIRDVGSGAASMSGWFDGPASTNGQVPRVYFSCAPDPKDPEAPWTGKIQVPQYAAKGTWKVGLIRLQDKAQNFRQYTSGDPVVAGHVFEVQ